MEPKVITKETKPEDFIVDEIIDLDNKPGNYLYVKLVKKNLNTLDIINELSTALKIPRSYIGFAGNKDKHAVTTQYISLYNVKKESLKNFKILNAHLIPLHYGSRPIVLGSLIGNHFKVKVDFKIKRRIRFDYLVNYFGEQRFSSNNKDVGKALLVRDFRKACRLINNDKINNYLKNNPNDYIGALKTLDKYLLSLYVNAFQAYLWNEVAKSIIIKTHKKYIIYENLLFVERPKSNFIIPLISYDTKFKNNFIKDFYIELLKKENISLVNYFIREFPNITFKTSSRPLFVKVKSLKVYKDHIEFDLPKGSFATVFIKNLKALNK